MDPLAPRPGETCTMMWNRLMSAERAEAQFWQQLGRYPTMTSWMLARGCTPVALPQQPNKYPWKRPAPLTTFGGRKVVRIPAGHVR